jgi:hypothetical protein
VELRRQKKQTYRFIAFLTAFYSPNVLPTTTGFRNRAMDYTISFVEKASKGALLYGCNTPKSLCYCEFSDFGWHTASNKKKLPFELIKC